MMTRQRCAICDCDREGNVWPESAEFLCDAHWLASSVRSLVRAGAWSEFDMNLWGKRPNHAGMLLTRDPKEAEKRHSWQAVVLPALTGKRVAWEGEQYDPTESEGDRYTAMTGLVAAWVWHEVMRAMVTKRRAA